jgi:hypothetical protein
VNDHLDDHQLRPDHLPTPFSAAQIRDAMRPGNTLRLRLETRGEEPQLRVTRFAETDAEGAVQESQRFTIHGEPLGEPVGRRSTWLELQEHASFPAATTTRTEETIDLEFGRFDGLHYVAVNGDQTEHYWFALALPGMPVKTEDWEGGELLSSMTMIERIPGEAG